MRISKYEKKSFLLEMQIQFFLSGYQVCEFRRH